MYISCRNMIKKQLSITELQHFIIVMQFSSTELKLTTTDTVDLIAKVKSNSEIHDFGALTIYYYPQPQKIYFWR